jgi:hypothetical protein
MTENIYRKTGVTQYITPVCTLVDINTEGVLCSSIDPFEKEFEYNPWGTNEE